MIFAEMPFADI